VLYGLRLTAQNLATLSTGSTFDSVSGAALRRHTLPVAPPAEQRGVVAEIEKQFTRLEAGVESLKRVQANLKRHRAAVLKAVIEGRLVPTEAELACRECRGVPRFRWGEVATRGCCGVKKSAWQDRSRAGAKGFHRVRGRYLP